MTRSSGSPSPKEWEGPGIGDVAQEAQGGWEGFLCYTNEIRRGLRGLEKGDVGGLDQKESVMQWASGQRG